MGNKIKILLIEDNPSDARLIDIYLKQAFSNLYFLTNVPTLSKGFELLDRNQFDIILLDLSLPDSNGLTTFKKLFARYSGIPVVVLTGINDESLGLVTVQLGAQEFLFKNDLDSKILKRAVNYSIERHLLLAKLKEYNRKLEFSEKRLKEAQQIAHLGHWELDLASGNMTWSEELYNIHGLNPEIFKPTYEEQMKKVHPEDVGWLKSSIENSMRNYNSFGVNYRIICSDGSERFVYGKTDVIKNSEGKIVRVIGTIQDITDAKKEEELEMLSHVASKSYNSVTIADRRGKVEWINEGFTKLFGYSLEEIKGTSAEILKKGKKTGLSEGDKIYNKLITEKRPVTYESKNYKKNGDVLWLITSITPVLNDKGEINKFISIDSNITKQKQAEQELRKTTFLLTQLIENLIAGVIFEDERRNILYINKGFMQLFKIDLMPEEMIELNGVEFMEKYKINFQDQEKFVDDINTIITQRKIVSYEELTLIDGRTFERNGVPIIVDHEYRGYLWIYSDYTDKKKAHEELKAANRMAEHSLLKGSKALDQLMNAKQNLEEALKIKDQFFANMSHEIRTPMNAIVGFTHLLLKSELTTDQKQYINAIKVSGENLLVIINDILDFSKLKSGKIIFEKIKFKVAQVVSSLIELMLPKAIEKSIKLSSVVDEKIPEYIIGDPTRLTQIFINLVGNAIKFTSEGLVKITVNLIQESQQSVSLEFSVIDTGIGIPESQLSSIFESFTQASSQSTRKYGGTGLGLTITKQLVELQGGVISVKSEVNKGSAFSFQLEFEKYNNLIDSTTDYPNDKEYLIMNNMEKVKVLLVEDNLLNQLLAKKVLMDWKWDVEVADNGIMAIDKVQQNNYDVVLMDIQMPEMDGYEATHQIREKLTFPKNNIPIIAMTAHAMTGEAERCIHAGMNDYISKPFDQTKLYSKIMSIVSKNKKNSVENSPPVTIHAENNKSTSSGKSVDLGYLIQLANGSNKFITEIIDLFLHQTPEAIAFIEKHLNNQDWKSLRAVTHKIKPSISFMGISDLTEVVNKIEEYADQKINLNLLPELIEKVKNICNRAYTELQAEKTRFL